MFLGPLWGPLNKYLFWVEGKGQTSPKLKMATYNSREVLRGTTACLADCPEYAISATSVHDMDLLNGLPLRFVPGNRIFKPDRIKLSRLDVAQRRGMTA